MKIKLLLIFIAAGLLVFLIIFIPGWLNLTRHSSVGQNIRASLFSHLSSFRAFVNSLKTMNGLINDNAALEEDKIELLARLATYSDLEEENRFLKEALRLDFLPEYRIIEAKTFSVQFTPKGHNLLINKGLESGIKQGDIIITSSGVLLGQIVTVHDDFSQANFITDTSSKAMVQLLDRKVAGIARGVLSDGLALDFISQSDEVAMDDMIITSGNDLIPQGLIIGKINRIGPDNGSLFREITIKPEFKDLDISRVLIL